MASRRSKLNLVQSDEDVVLPVTSASARTGGSQSPTRRTAPGQLERGAPAATISRSTRKAESASVRAQAAADAAQAEADVAAQAASDAEDAEAEAVQPVLRRRGTQRQQQVVAEPEEPEEVPVRRSASHVSPHRSAGSSSGSAKSAGHVSPTARVASLRAGRSTVFKKVVSPRKAGKTPATPADRSPITLANFDISRATDVKSSSDDNSYTLEQLRKFGQENKIKDYSGKNKSDLIAIILNWLEESKTPRKAKKLTGKTVLGVELDRVSGEPSHADDNSYTRNQLTDIAGELNIEGRHKMNKMDLAATILAELKANPNPREKVEYTARAELEAIDKNRVTDAKTSPRATDAGVRPYTVTELRAIAKELNIERPSRMDKSELVAAILADLSAPSHKKAVNRVASPKSNDEVKDLDMSRVSTDRSTKEANSPYTTDELKAFAGRLGISGRYKMSKPELVAAIQALRGVRKTANKKK